MEVYTLIAEHTEYSGVANRHSGNVSRYFEAKCHGKLGAPYTRRSAISPLGLVSRNIL